MRYTVGLVPDGRDGRYVAYVPIIPGCVTQGETIEEALAMVEDASGALLASMANHDGYLPDENPGAINASINVAVPSAVRVSAPA